MMIHKRLRVLAVAGALALMMAMPAAAKGCDGANVPLQSYLAANCGKSTAVVVTACQKEAVAREAAYAKSVKAYQKAAAAREAAYLASIEKGPCAPSASAYAAQLCCGK